MFVLKGVEFLCVVEFLGVGLSIALCEDWGGGMEVFLVGVSFWV